MKRFLILGGLLAAFGAANAQSNNTEFRQLESQGNKSFLSFDINVLAATIDSLQAAIDNLEAASSSAPADTRTIVEGTRTGATVRTDRGDMINCTIDLGPGDWMIHFRTVMSQSSGLTFNSGAPDTYYQRVCLSSSPSQFTYADHPDGASPCIDGIWHKGDAIGILDGSIAVSNNTEGTITYSFYKSYTGPNGDGYDPEFGITGSGSNTGTSYTEMVNFGNTGIVHEHLYAVPIK